MSATGQLQAFLAQHRNAVLAGGAVAAAGTAYIVRRRNQAGRVASDVISPNAAAGYGYPQQSVGGPGYDSTASDVYNSLQPQLEAAMSTWSDSLAQLQQQIAALNDRPPTAVAPPATVGRPSPYSYATLQHAASLVRSLPSPAPRPPAPAATFPTASSTLANRMQKLWD